MSQGANVRSVEAIQAFKIALINFAEDARNALGSVDMEIRMVRNWLVRDQLSYWQSQIKRCQERLAMARTELHRRKLSQSNSDAVSDTEQKEAVRDAQRRLQEAEDKVMRIKRWIPILEHAISEYDSQSQPLGDRLSGSFVATLNLIDRMLDALDSYLSTAAPSTPIARPPRPAGAEEAESRTPREAAAAEDPSPPVEAAEEKEPEPATAATNPGPADLTGEPEP
jgi:chromosome segregation ATPase